MIAATDQRRLAHLTAEAPWTRRLRILLARAKRDPQEIALVLRGWHYRHHFVAARWPRIAAGTRIARHAGTIRLGFGVKLEACEIAVLGGQLTIGDLTTIGSGTRINCRQRITIGAYGSIAWGVDILDTSFHAIDGSDPDAPVEIGEHVWIGLKATILPGAGIGADSVVAAGAVVVTGRYPPGALLAGNPARVVKQIDGWHR